MESSTTNRTAPSRPGRSHRGRALAVTALAAGTLIAALAPVTTTAGASERSAPPAAISWTGCGTQLECARVSVPLDWAQHGGRTITLSVIRHLASHPGQRIGSLFVNPGGPGDSGVAAVAEQGGALDAITGGRFDIVGWDPRGSGGSTPVSCFASSAEREAFWQGMPVPTTRQDEQRYLAKSVALAQRCGARNGDLLAHISTADTARDLDYLRGLVGDSRLTFYGQSTGSFLGETYANLFPHRVRAMALDGVEDPVSYAADLATLLASILTSTDQVFHEFLALCERVGPASCALAGHGPVEKRVEAMLQQLRHHPIPAPSAEPPGELTYGEALTLLKLDMLPTSGDLAGRRGNHRRHGARRRLRGGDHRPGRRRGAVPQSLRAEHRAAVRRQSRPAERPAVAAGRAPARNGKPHRGTGYGLAGSRVRRLADPQRGPLHRTVERRHSPTRSCSSAPGSTPRHPWPMPRSPSGGWATPCC